MAVDMAEIRECSAVVSGTVVELAAVSHVGRAINEKLLHLPLQHFAGNYIACLPHAYYRCSRGISFGVPRDTNRDGKFE